MCIGKEQSCTHSHAHMNAHTVNTVQYTILYGGCDVCMGTLNVKWAFALVRSEEVASLHKDNQRTLSLRPVLHGHKSSSASIIT